MRDEFRNPITKAIHSLVEGMCEHRSTLNIEEIETDDSLLVTIRPNTADTPLLVGKQGAGIKALEWLVEKAGNLAGKKCFVTLENSFTGKTGSFQPFIANEQFDLEVLKRLLFQWLSIVFDKPVGMNFRNGKPNELKVFLNPENFTVDDEVTIRALAQVFYPYGYRNGCIVKIRPMEALR